MEAPKFDTILLQFDLNDMRRDNIHSGTYNRLTESFLAYNLHKIGTALKNSINNE